MLGNKLLNNIKKGFIVLLSGVELFILGSRMSIMARLVLFCFKKCKKIYSVIARCPEKNFQTGKYQAWW